MENTNLYKYNEFNKMQNNLSFTIEQKLIRFKNIFDTKNNTKYDKKYDKKNNTKYGGNTINHTIIYN
jgi:hypothetical protein